MNSVEVVTASRLHFGLTRVLPSPDGRYAGIGVMVEPPVTALEVRPGAAISAQPVKALADAWLNYLERRSAGPGIELKESPPRHSGLGSGTQLAQAVAAGVNSWLGVDPPDVEQVARVLDRGQRSRVGSLGFARGGLVVDPIASPAGSTEPDSQPLPLPDSWRVVLVRHRATGRTFGERERAAFARLQGHGNDRGRDLEQLIEQEIVPAARRGDFSAFSNAVFEYGYQSGLYYREIQGGPWNGPGVAAVVETLRGTGLTGVGQSSWGPVVYGWCEDEALAREVERVAARRHGDEAAVTVSRVRNCPATVRTHARHDD